GVPGHSPRLSPTAPHAGPGRIRLPRRGEGEEVLPQARARGPCAATGGYRRGPAKLPPARAAERVSPGRMPPARFPPPTPALVEGHVFHRSPVGWAIAILRRWVAQREQRGGVHVLRNAELLLDLLLEAAPRARRQDAGEPEPASRQQHVLHGRIDARPTIDVARRAVVLQTA